MQAIKKITFVTGNKNKLQEVISILGEAASHYEIINKNIDLPEIQGEPEDIAIKKCKVAASKVYSSFKILKCDTPVMIEDTSLCFNGLKGLPGPYIKYFLEKLGHDGLNKLLYGFEDKTAYAQCIFAFCNTADSEVKLFVGRVNGKIVEPRGPPNFGWDAVFEPEGYDQTFAEMDKKIKNTMSHRFKALDQLKKFLITNQDTS